MPEQAVERAGVRVSRLASCGFTSPDVPRMVAYYEEVLGLSSYAREADGTAYMAIAPDAPSIVLRPSEAAGLDRIGLALAAGTPVEGTLAGLKRHGVDATIASDPAPGVAATVDFADPEGRQVSLLVPAQQTSSGQSVARTPRRGVDPQKLGHVAQRVADPQALARFFQEVLGFRVSDWIGDFFVFMRCGAEHHGLNFVRSPGPGRLDHLAFHLLDAAHLGRACDALAAHGIELIWGVGRHGAGHNLFAYYRDPDDHIVELVAEMDLMLDEGLGHFDPRPWHEDFPQRPKVWEPGLGPNQWGIGLPEEMLR